MTAYNEAPCRHRPLCWYEIEIANIRNQIECDYVDEQIHWWITEGIPTYEACIALYGKAPAVMRWDQLRERMIRDFT